MLYYNGRSKTELFATEEEANKRNEYRKELCASSWPTTIGEVFVVASRGLGTVPQSAVMRACCHVKLDNCMLIDVVVVATEISFCYTA
jgi:hypothetical protein